MVDSLVFFSDHKTKLSTVFHILQKAFAEKNTKILSLRGRGQGFYDKTTQVLLLNSVIRET